MSIKLTTRARSEVLLFVYGTLRRGVGHTAHRALARSADFVGIAYFQGRIYDLGQFPGAVASSRRTDRVIGELYKLHRPGKTLALLDEYEGRDFTRREATVRDAKGRRRACWIYLFSGNVGNSGIIESGDYAAFLQKR